MASSEVAEDASNAHDGYDNWDSSIISAIQSLASPTSRVQQFITKHPSALPELRKKVQTLALPIPLAPFQEHPTYLIRYLLAEWKDEELKQFRTDISLIVTKATERIIATQKWRSGEGECWKEWGYKNMDEMYQNYTSTSEEDDVLQKWYFQAFFGLDTDGRPIHFELLPNSYHENLMKPLIMRRVLNNEMTLRERIPRLNPPPSSASAEQLADPKLGATWVLDARNLSFFASPAMYKTMSGLMSYSTAITSAHYPEQGYRAIIINLGTVLISLYNLAMKLMPAQTQRTTNCYGGSEILDQVVGKDKLPVLFKAENDRKGVSGFTKMELEKQRNDGDLGHWILK